MTSSWEQVRIFDPWLLLLWTVPLTMISPIFYEHTVFLYSQGADAYLREIDRFPFAFRATTGPFSGSNVISLAPYLIDMAVAAFAFHVIALALCTIIPPVVLRLALIGVAILAWPVGLFVSLVTWADTWAVNWWVLGAADYRI